MRSHPRPVDSFDSFLHTSSGLVVTSSSTLGFMPKSVMGLPQGGVNRTAAQFEGRGDELWFDSSSRWEGGEVLVEGAGPKDKAMSDHMLLIAAIQL